MEPTGFVLSGLVNLISTLSNVEMFGTTFGVVTDLGLLVFAGIMIAYLKMGKKKSKK